MALLKADGFETYPGADGAAITGADLAPMWGGPVVGAGVGNGVFMAVGPCNKGRALEIKGVNSGITTALPSVTGRRWILHMLFNPRAGQAGDLLRFDNGAGDQAYIKWDNGVIYFIGTYSHYGTWSATIQAPAGEWTSLEVKGNYFTGWGVAVDTTFRVNGMDAGGPYVYDDQSGGTNFNQMQICGIGDAGVLIDNLVLMDDTGTELNDFIGPTAVRFLPPIADGTVTDFTPSSGGTTNFDMVDETPHDTDTTYVQSATSGHRDVFTVDTAPIAGTIHAVIPFARGKKVDSIGRTIRIVSKQGATVQVSDERSLGDNYQKQYDIKTLDPGTAAAWTKAGLGTAEFGYENV